MKTHARRYKFHAFAAYSQARENILHKCGVLLSFPCSATEYYGKNPIKFHGKL